MKIESHKKWRLAIYTLIGITFFGSVWYVYAFDYFKISQPITKNEELVLPETPRFVFDKIPLEARSAIVYDLSNGTILFEKNSELKLPLASLTKLISTGAALNTLSPEDEVRITQYALASEGDSGFLMSETFEAKELAKASIVASSNDAITALVESAAEREGQKDAQSYLQASVAALFLNQTLVHNSTGLDETINEAGAYGTARDMALLAGTFIKEHPDIAYASTKEHVTISSNEGNVRTFKNTHKDIEKYPGVLLSKTGFTDLAGGNLLMVFDLAINHPIAIVVLGSTQEGRFTDVDMLYKRVRNAYTP